MITDVNVVDNTLVCNLNCGNKLIKPLQSLGAVQITCMRNLVDCASEEIIQKLAHIQSNIINKKVVEEYFKGVRL